MTDLILNITRFDIFDRPATDDMDEMTVVRFFAKRKLIGEMDTNDCVRYGGDDFDNDDFTAWLVTGKGGALRTVGEAMDYLGEEPSEDGDEEDEEREPGSIVPDKYRVRYGAPQNCGDAIAVALTAHVTLPRATKKDTDGGLDRAKLYEVARINNILDKYENWLESDLNGGLLRMNTSNVLRGKNRRGEGVIIGDEEWPAHEVPKKVRAKRVRSNPTDTELNAKARRASKAK